MIALNSSDNRGKWQRVSSSHPCPICGKPDWCLTTGPVDNPDAVICSRTESDKRVGTKGAGWLHRLRDDSEWRAACRRSVRIDTPAKLRLDVNLLESVAAECVLALTPRREAMLAEQLGVSARALNRLQMGWSAWHQSFTFPMRAGDGNPTGMRFRGVDGRKWSLTGSREGIFIPHDLRNDARLLLICEGPTDTAAILDLGFEAIGRPSCNGGGRCVLGLVLADHRFTPREVVIVADDDGPGQRGAWRLASVLVSYVPTVRVISPPAGSKDAREWKRQGATYDNVLAVIEESPALQIRYGVKAVAR